MPTGGHAPRFVAEVPKSRAGNQNQVPGLTYDEKLRKEGDMKSVTTILSAALIAASSTFAMAQGAGGGAGGGGAGSDVNPDRMGKGADQNPTGPAANPPGGTKEATTPGTPAPAAKAPTGMTTAPVAGTKGSKDSSNPAQAPTSDKK